MDPILFSFITLVSLVAITIAYRWLRHVPVSKGFVSAAVGLAAFAGVAAVFGWAGDDPQRLSALLAVMVGVVLFIAFQILRRRGARRASGIEESAGHDLA